MKKIFFIFVLISAYLHAEIKLTKQMLDNDIETYEFQLFISKTLDLSLEQLKSKISFMGSYGKYQDFYKKSLSDEKLLSQGTKEAMLNGAVRGTLKTLESAKALQLINYDNLLKNAGMGVGIGLIVNPLAKMAFGDDTYVQVVDYYKGSTPVTRITKLIISDEGLPKDELKMIFNTTNDESYHYNDGKVLSLASQGGILKKDKKDRK